MGERDETPEPEGEVGPKSPVVRSPFLSDDRPRSVRWPWSRSVLGAIGSLLLPLVWVVETSECGGGTPRERTGVDLVEGIGPDPGDTVPIVLAVMLCLAAPWVAAALVGAGQRLLVTAVGALASLATAAIVAALVSFTIFETRTLRPAGYAVVLVAGVLALDGLVRLGFGIREWLRARSRRAGPLGPEA